MADEFVIDPAMRSKLRIARRSAADLLLLQSDYARKLTADRLTLEFSSASRVRVDGGKEPIEHSPLFGGAPQSSMFGGNDGE